MYVYRYQIAADGFSIDDKIVVHCAANDHFNPKCINWFVPISVSSLYTVPAEIYNKLHAENQRLWHY